MQRRPRQTLDQGRKEDDDDDRAPRSSRIAGVATLLIAFGLVTIAWWHQSSTQDGELMDFFTPRPAVTTHTDSDKSAAAAAAAALHTTTSQSLARSTEPGSSRAFNAKACGALSTMQICAHRANADELSAGPNLVASIKALCTTAHVCCFDMDAFATSDGHLLVGRPADADAALAALNATQPASSLTLSELQRMGLSLDRFPLLTPTLHAFSTAMHEGAAAPHSHQHRGGRPLLLLELKGAAMNEQIVSYVAQQAALARVSRHVALWFTDAGDIAQSDALHKHMSRTNSQMRTIRGYLDRRNGTAEAGVLPVGHMRPQDAKQYNLLGPSLRLPDAALEAMTATGLPVVAWTISAEEDVWRAARLGIRAVITDHPVRMTRAIQDLRAKHCGAAVVRTG